MLLGLMKQILFEKNLYIFSSIDDVPDSLVKTPLQRTIQILKRHRDMRFSNKESEPDKPISMILTTLSAKLYQYEEDIYSTLKNIVEQLDSYSRLLHPDFYQKEDRNLPDFIIRKNEGTWYIQNPVNPKENFADRWHENENRKAKAFFKWVSWVRNDLIEILLQADINKIQKSLKEQFGETIIEKASSNIYWSSSPVILVSQKEKIPHVEIKNPPKPWRIHD